MELIWLSGSSFDLTCFRTPEDNAMAVDIREIQLTDEQKRRIAEIAEQTGCTWQEVVNEQLATSDVPTKLKPYWSYKDRYIEDYDKWQVYFREWLSKQTSRNPNFDDSRESIYP
jgi:hypothetical protein